MLLVRSSLVSMYPQRIHSLKFYKPKTNLSEKDLKKKVVTYGLFVVLYFIWLNIEP
ncbi:hypothetical protein Hanom_Chr05g00461521 [Helianthus anomalus]